MPFDTFRKLLLGSVALLVLLLIWHDPQGTAGSANDVVHGVGSFFATGITKFTEFVRALV